jgi:hypothetical protein
MVASANSLRSAFEHPDVHGAINVHVAPLSRERKTP